MKIRELARDAVPAEVEAWIVEEDTQRILSTPAEAPASSGHPIRVLTGALESEATEPGTAVMASAEPLRIHAVVVDLEAEAHSKVEWVQSALRQALEIAQRRGARSVAVELLGAVHGGLDVDVARGVVIDVLAGADASLETAWVVTPG